MSAIIRTILQRELATANDDLLRASIELEKTKGMEPDYRNMLDYIDGKKALVRDLLKEIGG